MKYEDIYNTYFKDVYRYTLSITGNVAIAEDITSETFFSALKNIDKFDGKCKLKVWLCQIAKNKYYDYLKKEKRNKYIDLDTIPDDNNIENNLLNKENSLKIYAVLHKLDEPYKEVFNLHIFAELSFKDIAAIFDKTESWARVTYYRAKIKIKEKIK